MRRWQEIGQLPIASLDPVHNLGLALIQDRQFEAAITVYDRALGLDPNRAAVRWDRALARLQLGDYAGGWADYEARLVTGQIPPRPLSGIRWDGAARQSG